VAQNISCYSPFSIMTGKTLFYLMLYIIMGVYMYTCVTQIFTLPQIGDYITFLLFLILYLLACISMALVLSLLVYRREDCIMLFVFLSVPLLFLSGISWPGAKMPLFWTYVSWLFPSTFGMNGYVSITSMGCSLSDISTECIGLAIQSIAYFTAYALFFCRKPCL
ncbi:MAG: ABC transporter permease, partial [Prevotella sp.]